MNEYDIMKESIYKNIQELSEFLVDELKVNNYYDLIDTIIYLHNFRAIAYKYDKKLTEKIIKELESEEK